MTKEAGKVVLNEGTEQFASVSDDVRRSRFEDGKRQGVPMALFRVAMVLPAEIAGSLLAYVMQLEGEVVGVVSKKGKQSFYDSAASVYALLDRTFSAAGLKLAGAIAGRKEGTVRSDIGKKLAGIK